MSDVLLEEDGTTMASRVLQFTSSAAKNALFELPLARRVERAVASQSATYEYLVYMRPSRQLQREAYDRLKNTKWDPFSPFVIPLAVEDLREAVYHNAPIVTRVDREFRSARKTFRQVVAPLKDDQRAVAVSFGSSIGWLRLQGTGDDRTDARVGDRFRSQASRVGAKAARKAVAERVGR